MQTYAAQPKRHLRFESLEPRNLMAADAAVTSVVPIEQGVLVRYELSETVQAASIQLQQPASGSVPGQLVVDFQLPGGALTAGHHEQLIAVDCEVHPGLVPTLVATSAPAPVQIEPGLADAVLSEGEGPPPVGGPNGIVRKPVFLDLNGAPQGGVWIVWGEIADDDDMQGFAIQFGGTAPGLGGRSDIVYANGKFLFTWTPPVGSQVVGKTATARVFDWADQIWSEVEEVVL